MNHDLLPENFYRGEVTCVIGERARRHFIFYNDHQLELLKTRKVLYVDGTFKICPKPFQQLYIIHAFIETEEHKKQVPLVYVLMSAATIDDYSAVRTRVAQTLGILQICSYICVILSHPPTKRKTLET